VSTRAEGPLVKASAVSQRGIGLVGIRLPPSGGSIVQDDRRDHDDGVRIVTGHGYPDGRLVPIGRPAPRRLPNGWCKASVLRGAGDGGKRHTDLDHAAMIANRSVDW